MPVVSSRTPSECLLNQMLRSIGMPADLIHTMYPDLIHNDVGMQTAS